MIFTDEPRLYFTSTIESDGVANVYKKDIVLLNNLDV